MTDTFTLDTSFLTDIPDNFGPPFPDGWCNQGLMRGLDGKHYAATRDNQDVAVMCAETGSVTHITYTRLIHDLTVFDFFDPTGYISVRVVWSAPGTPYFYIGILNPLSTEFYIALVMYKIVSDGTIVCVGGINWKTTGEGYGAFGGPQTFYGFNVIDGLLYVVGQTFQGLFAQYQPAVYILPLTEGMSSNLDGIVPFPYVQYLNLVYGFFGTNVYNFSNRAGQSYAVPVPIDNDWGILLYIGQAEYDYMAAHPGVNADWDVIIARGGPGVWWYNQTDIIDVSSQFGLTDVYTHLDGSASTNYYDDYVTPNCFVMGGTTYVMFMRSYTLPADLEPVGTYARARIYSWNGTTATQVLDQSTALFDPVSDCGVSEGARTTSYPQFVQGCYDPQARSIYYMYYGRAGVLDFHYIFGRLLDAVHTEGDWFWTFSDFRNTEFVDWQIKDNETGGFGADFISELETYYMLSDDTMLWMSDATVFTYLENQGRGTGLGLFMQPKWDWSESDSSNKFARNVQVYLPTLELVSTRQNNIRGKGRALQLHLTSEQGKDFNLLGWGVWHEKNARP